MEFPGFHPLSFETEEGNWVDCPIFYGEDPKSWVVLIEKFLNMFEIPIEQHVYFSSRQICGTAEHWVALNQGILRQCNWSQFVEVVCAEFDKSLHFKDHVVVEANLEVTESMVVDTTVECLEVVPKLDTNADKEGARVSLQNVTNNCKDTDVWSSKTRYISAYNMFDQMLTREVFNSIMISSQNRIDAKDYMSVFLQQYMLYSDNGWVTSVLNSEVSYGHHFVWRPGDPSEVCEQSSGCMTNSMGRCYKICESPVGKKTLFGLGLGIKLCNGTNARHKAKSALIGSVLWSSITVTEHISAIRGIEITTASVQESKFLNKGATCYISYPSLYLELDYKKIHSYDTVFMCFGLQFPTLVGWIGHTGAVCNCWFRLLLYDVNLGLCHDRWNLNRHTLGKTFTSSLIVCIITHVYAMGAHSTVFRVSSTFNEVVIKNSVELIAKANMIGMYKARFSYTKYYSSVIATSEQRDFIKNMITGTSGADCDVHTIDSVAGDSETGVPNDGQTHKDALHDFSLGVKQMIYYFNKIDSATPKFSKPQYEDNVGFIMKKLSFAKWNVQNVVRASVNFPQYILSVWYLLYWDNGTLKVVSELHHRHIVMLASLVSNVDCMEFFMDNVFLIPTGSTRAKEKVWIAIMVSPFSRHYNLSPDYYTTANAITFLSSTARNPFSPSLNAYLNWSVEARQLRQWISIDTSLKSRRTKISRTSEADVCLQFHSCGFLKAPVSVEDSSFQWSGTTKRCYGYNGEVLALFDTILVMDYMYLYLTIKERVAKIIIINQEHMLTSLIVIHLALLSNFWGGVKIVSTAHEMWEEVNCKIFWQIRIVFLLQMLVSLHSASINLQEYIQLILLEYTIQCDKPDLRGVISSSGRLSIHTVMMIHVTAAVFFFFHWSRLDRDISLLIRMNIQLFDPGGWCRLQFDEVLMGTRTSLPEISVNTIVVLLQDYVTSSSVMFSSARAKAAGLFSLTGAMFLFSPISRISSRSRQLGVQLKVLNIENHNIQNLNRQPKTSITGGYAEVQRPVFSTEQSTLMPGEISVQDDSTNYMDSSTTLIFKVILPTICIRCTATFSFHAPLCASACIWCEVPELNSSLDLYVLLEYFSSIYGVLMLHLCTEQAGNSGIKGNTYRYGVLKVATVGSDNLQSYILHWYLGYFSSLQWPPSATCYPYQQLLCAPHESELQLSSGVVFRSAMIYISLSSHRMVIRTPITSASVFLSKYTAGMATLNINQIVGSCIVKYTSSVFEKLLSSSTFLDVSFRIALTETHGADPNVIKNSKVDPAIQKGLTDDVDDADAEERIRNWINGVYDADAVPFARYFQVHTHHDILFKRESRIQNQKGLHIDGWHKQDSIAERPLLKFARSSSSAVSVETDKCTPKSVVLALQSCWRIQYKYSSFRLSGIQWKHCCQATVRIHTLTQQSGIRGALLLCTNGFMCVSFTW